MLSLAFKLLISRKKWFLLLVVCFALVISSVVAIYSSTKTIQTNLVSQSIQQYGGFSGVVLGVKNGRANKNQSIEFGEYKLIDAYNIQNNISLNIGWADKKYFEIGEISLISGRFPLAEKEIIVESYYLKALDSTWKINQTRKIKVGDKKLSLKLVGIVENYSSRWIIRDNKYPNFFLFNSNQITKSDKSNFLVKFIKEKSINENINILPKVFENYNDYIINDNLLYFGLRDYEKISVLSLVLAIALLISSSFCIITMVTFFNINQKNKFAILKTLGCSNNNLHLISFTQTIYIYFSGIITSIPLILLFHSLIIKNSYVISAFSKTIFLDILLGVMSWIFTLFILVTSLHFLSNKKNQKNSINENIKEINTIDNKYSNIIDGNKFFTFKQLLFQFFTYRKQNILFLFTLSFSIILILLSVTFAKESQGIWNTKVDFYLNSQQMIGLKVINGHSVVLNKGNSFTPSEVREIESLRGIRFIEKSPYMLDVHPVIDDNLLTSTLKTWVNDYKFENGQYSLKGTIVPNVKYVLVTTEELSKLTSISNKKELENIVFMHIPEIKNDEIKILQGKNIKLSRSTLNENVISTETWDFKISKISNDPYEVNFDGTSNTNNEVTIILDERTAIEKKITQGYRELKIYTHDELSNNDAAFIYNKINELTIGVPGSLFQNISNLIFERTRITNFLDFLGKLSFYISVSFSIVSFSLVIYGKYKIQKRKWGIYRTLGMSTNRLFYYLLIELFVYYCLSLLITFAVYLLYLFLNKLVFSLISYIFFYILVIFLVLLMMIASALIIREKITKDSISKLLRIED
ncbi:ABC transporter permease [Paenibacillus sp. IB182496]|uniref:ABC transporter permease n=1 Tax=Paenibacillus sabuli TaxID=2772509 RepID=A0A927BU08_9BACL|nr:ABC transporter permease [Paenibacillus sabuli]MBD2845509.1 ABC transporter permease [Paenibacillus sabuli]